MKLLGIFICTSFAPLTLGAAVTGIKLNGAVARDWDSVAGATIQQLDVSPNHRVVDEASKLQARFAPGVCSFHATLRQVCDKIDNKDLYGFLTYMHIPKIMDNNKDTIFEPFHSVWPFDRWARVDLAEVRDVGDVFGVHLMTQWQGRGVGAGLKFLYGPCYWFAHDGRTGCAECSLGAWTKGESPCSRGNLGAWRTADLDCSFKCG